VHTPTCFEGYNGRRCWYRGELVDEYGQGRIDKRRAWLRERVGKVREDATTKPNRRTAWVLVSVMLSWWMRVVEEGLSLLSGESEKPGA
jgi:hypothetical protein